MKFKTFTILGTIIILLGGVFLFQNFKAENEKIDLSGEEVEFSIFKGEFTTTAESLKEETENGLVLSSFTVIRSADEYEPLSDSDEEVDFEKEMLVTIEKYFPSVSIYELEVKAVRADESSVKIYTETTIPSDSCVTLDMSRHFKETLKIKKPINSLNGCR